MSSLELEALYKLEERDELRKELEKRKLIEKGQQLPGQISEKKNKDQGQNKIQSQTNKI